jgi:hypothetical protein
MKKLTYVSILLAFISMNYNCATVFSGMTSKVNVNGSPEMSKVYYNGALQGTTPCKIIVAKSDLKNGAEIIIKKEGYTDGTIKLVRKVKGSAIVGDVLFTGLIGLVIDFATQAIYKPHPKEIKFDLEKKE